MATARWKDKALISALADDDTLPVTDTDDGNTDKHATPAKIGSYVASATLALTNKTFGDAPTPSTDDGAALGTTSLKWSDLFLASGAVVNFNSGDVTITHSSGQLALSGNLALADGYFDFPEISPPSNPGSTTARVYAEDESGFTTLHFVNGNGIDHELARDRLLTVRNASGGVLSQGEAVYVTGSNGTRVTVDKAKADSNTTMPAIGIVVEDISDNSFGQVMLGGDLKGLDTSGFMEGDNLYVSATTAGALTASAPSGASVIQRIGEVVTQNVGAGIIFVDAKGEFDPGLTQIFSNKSFSDAPTPSTDDGAALGTTSLKWSDAFFASGAVINFDSGDVTITHSSGLLTISGDFDIGTDFFFNATDGRLALGDEEYTMTIAASSVPSKFSVHTDGSEANAEFHTHGTTAGILGGSVVYGARSRGSEGSETVVQNGDFLMALAAVGHDGTDYAQGGRIDFLVDGTPGAGDMPTRINFRTSADGSESPTLRASFRADGSWQLEQGSVFVAEKSAADADKAGYGQWWVKDDTPNVPMFTDDAGNDETLAYQEPGINAQTGTSYTGVLADAGKVVTMDNASANTFTIPANSSVAYSTGTIINVIQKGAGTTTISGDTGVTLNGVSAGSGDISAQYAAAALIKIATDTWIVSGAIGTVA